VTSKALWQIAGHVLADGTRETRNAEVFGGIGIAARPKSSDRAEAIVMFPGGAAGNPVIVGLRNEDARRALELAIGKLKEGEAALYGSSGLPFVHVRDNGTVEIRKLAGITEPTIRGTTYRAAEDALLDAIGTAIAALAAAAPVLGGTAPQITAWNNAVLALAAALVTFHGGAPAYVTTVAKVQ
jgi:phage gp45-like